jgi:PAS domain S-box-containing protein
MEAVSLSGVLLAAAAAASSSAVTLLWARRAGRKASMHALALKESEERLRLSNEAAGIGTFTLDLAKGIARYSPELAAILGVPRVEITTIELAMARVHRDDVASVRSKFSAAAAGEDGGKVRMEFRFVRPGGEVRWMTWLGRVLFNGEAGGGPSPKMVGACLDITDRKRDEERIRFLMREVNHRSKNMLAIAMAIARQTLASQPPDFLERFNERIQALAASQDILVRNQWKGVDIAELVRFQLAHFADLIGTRIRIEGGALTISAAAAQILAMALHELAANAGKYGALSCEEGSVRIAWGLAPDGAGGTAFSMSWREENGPPVAPPATYGFGFTVLCTVAESGLNGKVGLDFPRTGLCWRLECDAKEVCDRSLRAEEPPRACPQSGKAHSVRA